MFEACHQFRHQWLEGIDESDSGERTAHAEHCETCARWLRVTRVQVRALHGLERLPAPAALLGRVVDELAHDTPVARALSGMSRLDVPDELAARLFPEAQTVHSDTHDASRDIGLQTLRTLSRLSAPPVLERLVAEELADAARTRVDRFAGDMEPRRAPLILDKRVLSALRRRLRPRSIAAPLATLAAAALLIWVAVLRGVDSAPEYPFNVSHVAQPDPLSPAAGLIHGMAGHMGAPAPMVPLSTGEEGR